MKKILAFTLILCMLFNMASFAIPVLDGAEAAELADEYVAEKIKPGVNVFTGTKNAITFDTEADLEYVTVSPRWMPNAVVDYEINSVSGRGNMLRFMNTNAVTDASEHFVVKLVFKSDTVVDRPAYFIARVYDACTYWGGLGGGWMRQNISGNWDGGTISKTFGEDNIPNSDTFQVEPWAIYSNNYWMCIDNVAVIPYYQITYKNILPDGTTGEDIVKYELDTTNISVTTNDGIIAGLPTSFEPNEELAYDGYTFLGWSTEENASEAMANVSLSNEDITLYPVWVEGGDAEGGDTEISLKPGVNVFTGTKNAITFNTEADLKYVTVGPRWMASAKVDYEINSVSGRGNMLRFINTDGVTDASGHFVVKLLFTADVTVDRPAYFVARVYDACTQWGGLGGGWMRTNLSGNWDGGYISKDFGADNIPNSNAFQVEPWAIYSNNYWMCIDNVAVIPYYQVTYKNILPDGTTVEDVVKYELDTSAISVSSNDGVIAGLPEILQPSETLEYEGYTLLGWSLTEGATEVSEITLENKDLVLYPVWKSGQSEPEPEPEVPSELILEDVRITEDGESVTITPVLVMESGNTLSDFTDMKVLYDIDNINVSPVINANGSLTITGKMNGETKVGVSLTYEDIVFTASAVVTVSGQIAKSPANNIKLITYGNSIMDHGPSDELSWTGNWGMAASSKENDYVHQLIYLIEGKYGKGSVTHVFGQKNNGFEGETNSATLDTDWETKLDGLSEWIASQNPDIITVQYGENSQQPDEAIYEKALTAFVNELKKGGHRMLSFLLLHRIGQIPAWEQISVQEQQRKS